MDQNRSQILQRPLNTLFVIVCAFSPSHLPSPPNVNCFFLFIYNSSQTSLLDATKTVPQRHNNSADGSRPFFQTHTHTHSNIKKTLARLKRGQPKNKKNSPLPVPSIVCDSFPYRLEGKKTDGANFVFILSSKRALGKESYLEYIGGSPRKTF